MSASGTGSSPAPPKRRAAKALVWFRNDLRLRDQPALAAAVRAGGPVVPVFIWAPEEDAPWPPGGASRWWLHQSLRALGAALESRGSGLVLRTGPSAETLEGLVRETGAEAVYFSARYEPAALARDEAVTARLRAMGAAVHPFHAGLLLDPGETHTRQGTPFQVFTPFWKSSLAVAEFPEPLPAPRELAPPERLPAVLPLERLDLEPVPDWAGGLRAAWRPGEEAAHDALARFLDEALAAYADARNRPGTPGTSRMSPHLHFGEISPRALWNAVRRHAALAREAGLVRGEEAYLRQVAWREFGHHLLVHFPHTDAAPLRPEFEAFPWRDDPAGLRAWQRGRTGYPLVDAGMRELWATGWMHNRARLAAASFLVKHLLLPWQEGARWFWDTLVDANLANNTLGWQWTAGCGADAAPYFRIFNPVLQGTRFD